MGNLVIALDRPRPGREQELPGVARDHVPDLAEAQERFPHFELLTI